MIRNFQVNEADKWYEEACQIVDMVAASLETYPEIKESRDFLTYTTAFGLVLRHVLFERLEEADILALREAATKVLPRQLHN